MGNIKEINTKNQTYDLKKKKSYKSIDIYNIGYVTTKIIDDYEDIYSVNPLYLIISEVDGHTEEKNGSKYLVFDSTDENKEVFKKYTELWGRTENEIETINGRKKFEYDKDFMNSTQMIICH